MTGSAASGEADPALDREVQRRRRDALLYTFALLLVVGLSLFAAYRFLRAPKPAAAELLAAAQQAVKEQFPPGLVFQFSGPSETDVVESGRNHYSVSGRFVAVAPNGAADYYTFTCNLSRAGTSRWRPIKLALQRQ